MTDPGDPETNAGLDVEYDWSETAPSTAVIEAVAASANVRPLDLDPLHGTVDADALDRLIAAGNGIEVSFTYGAHGVTVTGDGTVRVRPSRPRQDGQ